MLALGQPDLSAFTLGNATQANYLYILFSCAAFIMIIHLLNMLIAIMGNTFSERNEVALQIRRRDRLEFVIDNFYLKNIVFKTLETPLGLKVNKHLKFMTKENRIIDKVKYIIVAFH